MNVILLLFCYCISFFLNDSVISSFNSFAFYALTKTFMTPRKKPNEPEVENYWSKENDKISYKTALH